MIKKKVPDERVLNDGDGPTPSEVLQVKVALGHQHRQQVDQACVDFVGCSGFRVHGLRFRAWSFICRVGGLLSGV